MMAGTGEVKHYRNPFPTTDIIIEYKNCTKEGIVLITRKNPPYGIAIPGGFAEWGISLEENARKEAMEETGLEIIIENPGRPYVYSDPKRDPRGHMVSNTYYAKGFGSLRAGDDAKTARIYSIDEVIELVRNNRLAFDHSRILGDYLTNRGYNV
jgi:ADP-ribose pyrophosphatase YjhB (NUDIX family)